MSEKLDSCGSNLPPETEEQANHETFAVTTVDTEPRLRLRNRCEELKNMKAVFKKPRDATLRKLLRKVDSLATLGNYK